MKLILIFVLICLRYTFSFQPFQDKCPNGTGDALDTTQLLTKNWTLLVSNDVTIGVPSILPNGDICLEYNVAPDISDNNKIIITQTAYHYKVDEWSDRSLLTFLKTRVVLKYIGDSTYNALYLYGRYHKQCDGSDKIKDDREPTLTAKYKYIQPDAQLIIFWQCINEEENQSGQIVWLFIDTTYARKPNEVTAAAIKQSISRIKKYGIDIQRFKYPAFFNSKCQQICNKANQRINNVLLTIDVFTVLLIFCK